MGSIDLTKLRIEKLSRENLHRTEAFDCGDPDLNEFLREDALNYSTGKIAVTYICLYKGKVAGFYCLANDAIEVKGKPKKVLNRLGKPQKTYPAIKIGGLGIGKGFARKGVGSRIIEITIGSTLAYSNNVGCRYLSVDAYDEPHVTQFYEKNSFMYLKTKERKRKIPMYLDLLKRI